MSDLLERWLDPSRLADMLANDKAMGIEPQPQLRPFVVRIGARTAPRLDFPVMGVSRASVEQQHIVLAELGERFEVLTAEEAGRS